MGPVKPPPAKRARVAAGGDGKAEDHGDLGVLLTQLPQELQLLIVGYLEPRECASLRLCCKALCSLLDANVPHTLTVTNAMAQHALLNAAAHYRKGGSSAVGTGGWVSRLLQKFPTITHLEIKCSQPVLTIVARHLVRDSSISEAAVSEARLLQLADNVRTNSRRHSAVLLCELLKLRVAEGVPAPRAPTLDRVMFGKAEQQQQLTDYRLEAPKKVIELVDRVLQLKGHADAKAHEHFKYARDTLDDSLLQLVACLQPRHSKFAYQLLAKAADPAKAARGWRWLFYFLARQKQAEHAIEAYKVVDKPALLALSPTCLSELFRALIDNEITTQPESKLRAITSESGSWTKFLYRGNFSLTSVQSREGALEKVVADLLNKDYLDTAVNVMNRFESESTANEVWAQVLGALGIAMGGEVPLAHARDVHRVVSEQVDRAKKLLAVVTPARRTAGHAALIDLLVSEAHFDEAAEMCETYGEQGVLDKYLMRAISNSFGLAELPPEEYSPATCDLLMDLLRNRLHCVATKAELTGVLVRAYAARGELALAVQLASGLDASMVAAAAAAAAEAAAGADAVAPPAAAAVAGAGAAAGPVAAAAAAAAAAVGGMAGGAGPAPAAAAGGAAAAPTPEAAEAAEAQLASMWQALAEAAIRKGNSEALLKIIPHMEPAWLLAPCASGEPAAARRAEQPAASGSAGGPALSGGAGAAAGGAAAGAAAGGAAMGVINGDDGMLDLVDDDDGDDDEDDDDDDDEEEDSRAAASTRAARAATARPQTATHASSYRKLLATAKAAAAAAAAGAGPSTSAAATAAGAGTGHGAGTRTGAASFVPSCHATPPAEPPSLWQSGCVVLLRVGQRHDLVAAVTEVLASLRASELAEAAVPRHEGDSAAAAAARLARVREKGRAMAKALLEGVGHAAVAAGRPQAALDLARSCSVPSWPILNVVLPAMAAQDSSPQAMEAIVREVVAAASKHSPARAPAMHSGHRGGAWHLAVRGATGGSAAISSAEGGGEAAGPGPSRLRHATSGTLDGTVAGRAAKRRRAAGSSSSATSGDSSGDNQEDANAAGAGHGGNGADTDVEDSGGGAGGADVAAAAAAGTSMAAGDADEGRSEQHGIGAALRALMGPALNLFPDALGDGRLAGPSDAGGDADVRWEGAARTGLVADVIGFLTVSGRPSEALDLLQRLSGGNASGAQAAGAVAPGGRAATGEGAGPSGRPPRPSRTNTTPPQRGAKRPAGAGAKRNRIFGDEPDLAAALGLPGPSSVRSAAMFEESPVGLYVEAEADALDLAMTGLTKALIGQAQGGRGRSGVGGGRTSTSGAAAAAAAATAGPSSSSGGSGSAGGGSMAAGGGGDSLADCLEACRAWPPSLKRTQQVDALARKALQAKELDLALQFGELLWPHPGDDLQHLEVQQEKKLAATHRDLASHCIKQGRLDCATACIARISPSLVMELAGEAVRSLIKAYAKASDKKVATRLALKYVDNKEEQQELLKGLGAPKGSKAVTAAPSGKASGSAGTGSGGGGSTGGRVTRGTGATSRRSGRGE